jgi:hypothetical protein
VVGIIEHSEDERPEKAPMVRVGEGDARLPVKVYQAVYHQVTGRTEQIRKRYTESILVDFTDIEQLHFKISQLCDVHNIIAKNAIISIFHAKERKEQFTSFERLKIYNANSVSPTVSVVIKYNFSIIPAGLDQPQEYVVNVRLASRVAMFSDDEDVAPFAQGLWRYVGNTTEVTIDYVDYVIARGFLEAFDEWMRGCKSTPRPRWLAFAHRSSHLTPNTLKILMGLLIICVALRAVPAFFAHDASPALWARFAIFFGGGLYVLSELAHSVGGTLENAIDGYTTLSYIRLNKGDVKLIEDFLRKRRGVVWKFVVGCLWTIALGVLAIRIESMVWH